MRRPDGGVIRFFAWLGLGLALVFALYSGQVVTSLSLLDGIPGFPFAALLGLLLFLRWDALHSLLASEGGLLTRLPTRALGLGLALSPLAFAQYSAGSPELSAVSLILVFYGTSLLLNPSTVRMLFPYAGLCAVGMVAPTVIQYYVGEPMAGLETFLSARLVSLTGVPVTWHGTQFVLVSRVGGVVTATVTPDCSSVFSVTTFLGLLGLMYFDMKKEVSATLKLAIVGVVILVLMNISRIGILIWAGYSYGSAALWGLHSWVGYAMFLGFFVVVVVVYARMPGPKPVGVRLEGMARIPSGGIGREAAHGRSESSALAPGTK